MEDVKIQKEKKKEDWRAKKWRWRHEEETMGGTKLRVRGMGPDRGVGESPEGSNPGGKEMERGRRWSGEIEGKKGESTREGR